MGINDPLEGSISFGNRDVPFSYHIAGPVNYGYGDSLSNHSSPDHFTGCVVKDTLNIHECSNSESFKVRLVFNQIHRFAQGRFGRATGPVGMLIAM